MLIYTYTYTHTYIYIYTYTESFRAWIERSQKTASTPAAERLRHEPDVLTTALSSLVFLVCGVRVCLVPTAQ